MVLCRGAASRSSAEPRGYCVDLVAGKEQVANAGRQKWDYCAPKVNYADVRARVANAFAEKANELADAIAVVQGLSKDTSRSLVAAALLFV